MHIFKTRRFQHCRILLRGNGLMVNWVLVLFVVMLSGCNNFKCAGTFTQTHHGSAPPIEFDLTSESPDARIRISNSNSVFIVNVHLPSPYIDSLRMKDGPQPYKVSLELLALKLCAPSKTIYGDRLKVCYSDSSGAKSKTWKYNTSHPSSNYPISSTEETRELTGIQSNQIVLIPKGQWVKSKADLVATLYLGPSSDGTCPEGTFPCSCKKSKERQRKSSFSVSSESQLKISRCIPSSLVCNGQPNCGLGCLNEESESHCSGTLTSHTPNAHTFTRRTTTTEPPKEDNNFAVGKYPKASVTIWAVNAILAVLINGILF